MIIITILLLSLVQNYESSRFLDDGLKGEGGAMPSAKVLLCKTYLGRKSRRRPEIVYQPSGVIYLPTS